MIVRRVVRVGGFYFLRCGEGGMGVEAVEIDRYTRKRFYKDYKW